jgi:hypothetical protein
MKRLLGMSAVLWFLSLVFAQDPCSLLTPEEASAVLGETVGLSYADETLMTLGDSYRFSFCRFPSDTAPAERWLSVGMYQPLEGEEAAWDVNTQWQNLVTTFQDDRPERFQNVADLGEEAFYVPQGLTNSERLFVLRGNHVLLLESWGAQSSLESLESLAQTALARLP